MSRDTSTDPSTGTGTSVLRDAVAEAHDHVLAGLGEPERAGPAAVAWGSAHLVAVDRVLYAAARSVLPDARRRLHLLRLTDRSLQRALFRLDRRLTGDVHLDGVPVSEVAHEVHGRLRDHVRRERRLLDALSAALTPEQCRDLAERLAAATATAPTRPHPHTPHTPASRLVSWADAVVDRVRDVMDNRTTALGRPVRAPRPQGRWGSYLLGAPSGPDAVHLHEEEERR